MGSQHRNQNVCPTVLLLMSFKRSAFIIDMRRTWLKVGEPFFTPLQVGRVGDYFSSLSKKHFTFGWHGNDIRALFGSFWGSQKVRTFQLKTQSRSFTLSLTKGGRVGKSTYIRIGFIQNPINNHIVLLFQSKNKSVKQCHKLRMYVWRAVWAASSHLWIPSEDFHRISGNHIERHKIDCHIVINRILK